MSIQCPCCSEQHEKTCECATGKGHSRSLANLNTAVLGLVFIIISFAFDLFFPEQIFNAELSAIIALIILSLPIFIISVKDILQGRVYMNELVSLAILASISSGSFREASIISFFLLLSIIIESSTAKGAEKSIEKLVNLTPDVAILIEKCGEKVVDVSALSTRDIIKVKPGDNFPIDGVVLKGETVVDQSSITGEAKPIDKVMGDEIFAGTVNLSGVVEVEVVRTGAQTALGKVKEMILEAESLSNPVVRFIDSYANFYTPTIIILAVFIWWLNPNDEPLKKITSLFVIACPCAIVLATPTATVAAFASAAKLGAYIKNINVIETLAKITAVIFDKTGTVTEGKLNIVDIVPAEGYSVTELLEISATIEQNSNHPIAKVICELANKADIELDNLTSFKEEHGKGSSANIGSKQYYIGRHSWVSSMVDCAIPKQQLDDSVSIVVVSSKDKFCGYITFSDKIKDSAKKCLDMLREFGIKKCDLVTGDLATVAKTITEQLDFDEYLAECLPEEKVNYLKKQKQVYTVAFVGDGINDAPALANADAGIAIASTGSDIAVGSASVALMSEDISQIPKLLEIARQTLQIIHQNLLISICFVLGGIFLSLLGFVTPILAATLHLSGSLLVIANSSRLLKK
jgi:heavy metal translocating P-type ATPase